MNKPDPTISPDGQWRWDGQRWIPNTMRPTSPLPPRKGHKMRNLGIGCASVFGFFVLFGIIGAIASPKSSSSSPTPAASAIPTAKPAAASTPAPKPATPKPAACQQPCAVASGVTTTVSDVNYGADSGFMKPEAGNTFVTMNVTMSNADQSEASFNPFNFVLLDGTGVKHTATFTDACPMFSAVNLTKGATTTKCIAFEAAAGKPTGLTLVWTPSWLSGDHNIKLS